MTSNRNEIILFGAGDLALEVHAYLKDCDLRELSCDGPASSCVTDLIDHSGSISPDLERLFDTIKVHKSWDSIETLTGKRLIICIGDAAVRQRVLQEWQALPSKPALSTVIHPTAVVSPSAVLHPGAIIGPFAYIGPMAVIGENTLVNVHASIGHHVTLGRSCVVSPNAAINGRAALSDAVFVGSGAIVAPGQSIGRYSKVANGAIVSKGCDEGFLLVGNPAKGRQMFKIPEIEADQEWVT